VLGGPLLVCARGQEANSPDAPGRETTPTPQEKPTTSPRAATAYPNGASPAQIAAAITNVSPRVADILRMSDAGVEPRVIEAFVENSPGAFSPSAADIIALHQHGIADTLIAAIVQRGGRSRLQAAEPAAPAAGANSNPPPAQAVPATPYAEYDPNYGYSYPVYSYGGYPSYNYYWYPSPFYFGFNYRSYPHLYQPYYGYRPHYGYRPYHGYNGFGPYHGYQPHYGTRPWPPILHATL